MGGGAAKTTVDLIYEYAKDDDIDTLEQKLTELRILDLSCGSGAFLTKAADVLLDIHYEVHQYQRNRGLYQKEGNATLDEWIRETEYRKIIETNLFGIDINHKAAEIARLSLFFKIATKEERLPDLTSEIIVGNAVKGNTLDANPDNPKMRDMKRHGGFDIILGNPPYIEERNIKYEVDALATRACGNTFAYFIEKGLNLLRPGGRLGYIVPVASISTERMAPLQEYLVENSSELRISSYDNRPGKLFEGPEDTRLSIILCTKKVSKNEECEMYTTGYNRWYTKDVGGLFRNLLYVRNTVKTRAYIPKAGSEIELSILNKITRMKRLASCIRVKSEHKVVYHNAPRYWIRGMNFTPYFSRAGKQLISNHNKVFYVDNADTATAVTGLLNSSLFYWFFIKTSNCRDLTSFVIKDFPFDMILVGGELTDMKEAVSKLMADYKTNSIRKTTNNTLTGTVVYDEFYPAKSKAIIDEIDAILAKHYGLTVEEADCIKKFDIKFRMGVPEDETAAR